MRSFLIFSALVLAGCLGSESDCGPDTCTGCCTSAGICVGGSESLSCGAGGALCDVCVQSQVCLVGRCMSSLGATGGGTATGGGGGSTGGGAATGGGGSTGGGTATGGGASSGGGTATGGGAPTGGGTSTGGGSGTGGGVVSTSVNVGFTGVGHGTVEVSGATTQTCSGACADVGTMGRSVLLQARTPGQTALFAGFSGCTETNLGKCSVVASSNVNVQVRFDSVQGAAVSATLQSFSSTSSVSWPTASSNASGQLLVTFLATGLNTAFGSKTGLVLLRHDAGGALVSASALALPSGSDGLTSLLLADGSAWVAVRIYSSTTWLNTSRPAGGYLLHLTMQDAIDRVIAIGSSSSPRSLAVSSTGTVAVGGTAASLTINGMAPPTLGNASLSGINAFALEFDGATGAFVAGWRIGGRYEDSGGLVTYDTSDRLVVGAMIRDSGLIGGVSIGGSQFSGEAVLLRFTTAHAVDAVLRFPSSAETEVSGVVRFGSGVAMVGNYVGLPTFGNLPEIRGVVGSDFVALVNDSFQRDWVRASHGVFDSTLVTNGTELLVGGHFEGGGSWGAGSFVGAGFTSTTLVARFSATGTLLTNQAVSGALGTPGLTFRGSEVVVAGVFQNTLAVGNASLTWDGMSSDGYVARLGF